MNAIITQEEEMMKKAKSHAAFMVTIDKGKKKLFKCNSSTSHSMKRFRKSPQQASVSFPNGLKK